MLVYHLKQALKGMVRRPALQAACIGALAMALLVVSLVALGAHNVARLTADWGRERQMTVFAKLGAEPRQVDGIERLLRSRREVRRLVRVRAAQALARLKSALGNEGALLDGLGAASLPVSFELKLREGTNAKDLRPLLALLAASPAVAEIDYQGQWAEKLGALLAAVRAATALVALIIGLACLYIVASTIRLGVFARRHEIEIQRLVGATGRFVRAPFLLEGALQGFLGAACGLALLFMLYNWAAPPLVGALGAAFHDAPLVFFSPLQISCGMLAGAALGLVGSGLAVGRHVA